MIYTILCDLLLYYGMYELHYHVCIVKIYINIYVPSADVVIVNFCCYARVKKPYPCCTYNTLGLRAGNDGVMSADDR